MYLETHGRSACSVDSDSAAAELLVREVILSHPSIGPVVEPKHHPAYMVVEVVILGWSWRPEEDDGAGLGELGSDMIFKFSPSSIEVNVAGDKQTPILSEVLDVLFPFRVVRHSA